MRKAVLILAVALLMVGALAVPALANAVDNPSDSDYLGECRSMDERQPFGQAQSEFIHNEVYKSIGDFKNYGQFLKWEIETQAYPVS